MSDFNMEANFTDICRGFLRGATDTEMHAMSAFIRDFSDVTDALRGEWGSAGLADLEGIYERELARHRRGVKPAMKKAA